MQLFWSCLSFGEECRSVNFESNVISTICETLHSHIPYHLCVVMRHLSTSHCWNFTILDSSTLKVTFLFGKSVCLINLRLYNIWYFSMGSFGCYSMTWLRVHVMDPVPGSPEKSWKLKMRFFWEECRVFLLDIWAIELDTTLKPNNCYQLSMIS